MFTLFVSLGISISGYCYLDQDKLHFINETIPNYSAYAIYEDSLNSTGWATIHIIGNLSDSDENQFKCGGFLDGYLSADRIYDRFVMFKEGNGFNETSEWPPLWKDWFTNNTVYVKQQIKDNKDDDYWKGINLILLQFQGLLDGINQKLQGSTKLSELDLWILQSGGDLDDLDSILSPPSKQKDPEFKLHCTGIIKIAPKYEDIYFAQDTWSDYLDLNGILKEYHFNSPLFPTKHVLVSTRAGQIPSMDDFWISGSGLFILETTFHNFNNQSYKYMVPESVLTWMRSYYATFASTSGKEWTEKFILQNSGTYNNEYLILDTKVFKKGQEPDTDLLWIIEQLPNYFHSADITKEFVNQTYWPSINTPWFLDVFNQAGYPEQQKIEPAKKDFWSYYGQYRYKIIARDAPKVQNYDDFQKLMRYNDYLHDDLLNNEPAQGILARYDLRPINGTPYGARRAFGGLDSKTAKLTETIGNLYFDAINSPEYHFNPPFNFSDWPDVNARNLPRVWTFPWQSFFSIDYNRCDVAKNEEDCLNLEFCGWCLYTTSCYPGQDNKGPQKGFSCEDGWRFKTETPAYALPLVITVSVVVGIFIIAVVLGHIYARKSYQPV